MDDSKLGPEVTPEGRLREKLRHFPTLLIRWAGGNAKVVELTTSHATLTLRIEDSRRDGNLQLRLAPPRYYRGPFHWQNCAIQVSLTDDLLIAISDPGADVEILTESVEIYENAGAPHRLVVPRGE